MTDQIDIPTDFSSHSLAEYVEAVCLIEDIDHLSLSELRARFPSGQQPSAAEISFGLAEIERRNTCSPEAYPYAHDGTAVLRTANAITPVYDFMTILSLESTPMRVGAQYTVPDALFDAVVRDAAKAYLGPAAQALRFGWPPKEGRPENFVEAVSWVGTRLGIEDALMDRPPDEKDAGVDVIAWKPFKDGRSGFQTLLVQNTMQADYGKKPRDVNPDAWMQWLRFGTAPSVGFAVPYAIAPGDDRWVKINNSADVIFDRTRIIENFVVDDALSMAELPEIEAFNTDQLTQIRMGSAAGPRIARPRKQRPSPYRVDAAR